MGGCTQKTGIAIDDPWVRPAPLPGGNGAGYMTLRNYDDEPDVLQSVTVDFAEMAEVHESVSTGEDTMTMQPTGPLEISAGDSLTFAPGGYHIMLMNIPEPLEPGQTVTLTLTFERAGSIEVQAEVRAE
jgi:copper(I)-binding protein